MDKVFLLTLGGWHIQNTHSHIHTEQKKKVVVQTCCSLPPTHTLYRVLDCILKCILISQSHMLRQMDWDAKQYMQRHAVNKDREGLNSLLPSIHRPVSNLSYTWFILQTRLEVWMGIWPDPCSMLFVTAVPQGSVPGLMMFSTSGLSYNPLLTRFWIVSWSGKTHGTLHNDAKDQRCTVLLFKGIV